MHKSHPRSHYARSDGGRSSSLHDHLHPEASPGSGLWPWLQAAASHRLGLLLVVWVISGVYLFTHYQFAGVPHDSGSLAHEAERVLSGQLPHRDFDSLYTGGLAFVHASAFWLLGVKLVSLRWVLLVAALLFVPTVYAIAVRVCPPLVSAAVTLLAVIWSVPNYFVGLPSWYNLFFALFGTWALLRHLETEHKRWLLLAGVCAGASIAIKLIGLYFVAAVLLYLLYREQALSEQMPGQRPGVYSAMISLGLVAFVAILVELVSYCLAPLEILHFVLPGAMLSLLLLWNEWRCPRTTARRRAARLAGLVVPFALGLLLPLLALLVPYLATSSLDAIYEGLVLSPLKRFAVAALPLADAHTALGLMFLAPLLVFPLLPPDSRLAYVLTIALGAGLLFWLSRGSDDWAYQAAWSSIRGAVPMTVLGGTLLLWSQIRRQAGLSAKQGQILFLLLAVEAMVSLVQLPYPQGIYLLYAAPTIILAAVVLMAFQAQRPKAILAGFFSFYLLFAIFWVRGGYPCSFAVQYVPVEQDRVLRMKRGGLLTNDTAATLYNVLISEIRKRTAPGDFIYAAPDSPEIYFLSGRKNPTRTFYDFFDDDYGQPGRDRRILNLLEERRVNVVVVRGFTEFSGDLPPDLHHELSARYPHLLRFCLPGLEDAPLMELRWRDPQAKASDLAQPLPPHGSAELHRPGT